MLNKKPENKGFIAIISLLIIATISMVLAITILKDGVENASLSLSSIYYEDARINAGICLEDTLMRIKLEDQFNQNLNYSITTEDGCTTNISWQTPQQVQPGLTETLVDLTVTGTAQNFSRSFDYDLKIKKYDVNYTDGSLEYTNNINIISIEEITS